ncbi:MAG: hypothetical protein HY319_29050 [Armatimonadetes bacterium]|nr:hypothetical protein [Armatimonadota bacterium]
MSGSTNFSNKGLKDNWEESTFVHFDPADEEAMTNRAQSVAQFDDLWKNEAFELTSRDVAAYWKRYKPEEGREYQIREAQQAAVNDVIHRIEEYERQSARWVQSLTRREDIANRAEELRSKGIAEGYADLMAIREVLGDRAYYEGLYEMPAYKELRELQTSIREWKERG